VSEVTPLYHVRQYRPNYFSGFDTEFYRNVPYEKITDAPWMENFKHSDFDHFTVTPYSDHELIVEAHYRDGQHWVAAFAVETTHPFAKNFRYLD
jgi:hypothetical protein